MSVNYTNKGDKVKTDCNKSEEESEEKQVKQTENNYGMAACVHCIHIKYEWSSNHITNNNQLKAKAFQLQSQDMRLKI